MTLASAQALSVAGVNIPTMDGGDNTWYQIAQWVLGGIALVLVVLLAYGVFLFVKGKFFRGSGEKRANGAVIGGLSVVGAVVLGTAATAVAWSGSNGDQLAGLLPADAAPGQTAVAERQAPLVSCDSSVEVESDRAMMGVGRHDPTSDDHRDHQDVLAYNGVLDQVMSDYFEEYDAAVQALYNQEVDDGGDADEAFLRENWGSDIRIGGIEWHPADHADGCDDSQYAARAGSTMEVQIVQTTAGSYSGDLEITMPDDPNYDSDMSDAPVTEPDEGSYDEDLMATPDDIIADPLQPTAENLSVSPGDTFEVMFRMENTGDADASGLEASFPLVNSLRLSSDREDICTSDASGDGYGGEVTCDLGTLEAGESRQVHFTVELEESYTGDGSDITRVGEIDAPNVDVD